MNSETVHLPWHIRTFWGPSVFFCQLNFWKLSKTVHHLDPHYNFWLAIDLTRESIDNDVTNFSENYSWTFGVAFIWKPNFFFSLWRHWDKFRFICVFRSTEAHNNVNFHFEHLIFNQTFQFEARRILQIIWYIVLNLTQWSTSSLLQFKMISLCIRYVVELKWKWIHSNSIQLRTDDFIVERNFTFISFDNIQLNSVKFQICWMGWFSILDSRLYYQISFLNTLYDYRWFTIENVIPYKS